MLQSIGLRAKLLTIMVGGTLVLAIVLSAITAVAFTIARNQALDAAGTGLIEQGRSYLDQLARRSAALIFEQLVDASDAGVVAEQALLVQATDQIISSDYLDRARLAELPDGALLSEQRGQQTTVYVPPEANANDAAALRDLRTSAILNAVFPKQRLSSRNIIAMAYVGPSGLIRLYPPENPRRRDFSRELQLLQRFRSSGEKHEIWLKPFRNLEIIGYGGLITAVARPVSIDTKFAGIIITYISLSSLSSDLNQLAPTTNSFAFVIDSEKTLIATSPKGMPYLLRQPVQALLEPQTIGTTASPELDQALEAMAARRSISSTTGENGREVARIAIEGQTFFLTYRPITMSNWSLGLMVPADELAAQAVTVSEAISSTSRTTQLVTIGCVILFALLALLLSHYMSGKIRRPLTALADAASAIADGNYNQRVPITARDELGQLATAFNQMSDSVLQSREQLQEQNRLLEQTVQDRTADLQRTVAELEESSERQTALYEMLRAVSIPVIPLADDILLMPLIGALDEDRAQLAIQTLLRSIEMQRSRAVILDVTGLPVIDTAVASTILRAARAVRLLGADMILAGIRPEVAETLVMLDVPMDELQLVANLQSALDLALQSAPHLKRNGA